MIEVVVLKNGIEELARIEIERTDIWRDGTADYIVRAGWENGTAQRFVRRSVGRFPRLKYNIMGLLTVVLAALEERDLELERDTAPSDLARGLRRTRIQIPR